MITLDFIWARNATWPGILHPYLDMFKSAMNRFFLSFDKSTGYVPSQQLEIISIMERVMQYLFSGNSAKLGNRDLLSSTGLSEALFFNQFPCLKPNYYDLKSFEVILENWPKRDENSYIFNCSSSYLKMGPIREAVFPLEESLKFRRDLKNLGMIFYVAYFIGNIIWSSFASITNAFHSTKDFKADISKDQRESIQISCKILFQDWKKLFIQLFLDESEPRVDSDEVAFLFCVWFQRKNDVKNWYILFF
jgi:hypothetical protein